MSQDCPNVGGDGEVNLVASSMVKMDTSHETVKILTEVGHDGFSDHDTNWTTFLYHLELQQQGRTTSWFMELEKLDVVSVLKMGTCHKIVLM
ncbi:uncharacterized protein LOC143243694 isoform X3 [Tachypleus tridentatus]|uniref:uncharacterized protein LOC143243694 isoform X3 n=1 Tax=Tachypleus tridentatus TaxID=6853 RepID=UPI003FD14292